MSNELFSFHQSCKTELNELLKHFNILFYGYGSKLNILNELFPDAVVFNMHFQSVKNIVEELVIAGYGSHRAVTIKDIDDWLVSKCKKMTLVLLNFHFGSIDFLELENIRIVATIEGIDIEFDFEDVERHNFIFRDLTTFEDYEDEVLGIELRDSKVHNAKMVLNNLSVKSRAVFKALLKLGNCTVGDLFDSVKKELFLTKYTSIIDLLKEFTSHKIIRIDENMIKIGLSKSDVSKLLQTYE